MRNFRQKHCRPTGLGLPADSYVGLRFASGYRSGAAIWPAIGREQTYGRGLLVRVPFAIAPAVQPIGVLGCRTPQVSGHNLGCQPQGQNQNTQAKQVHHGCDCTRKCAARQDEMRQHFQDAFLHEKEKGRVSFVLPVSWPKFSQEATFC